MCAQLGKEKTEAILDRAIRDAAIGAAPSFAAKTPGGTSLRSFQDLQHLWTQDDALIIDVLKTTDTELYYNVRRCRYADTYREMGLGRIGHLPSCNRDAAICVGYDLQIKLERTQALMQGAGHCDFRYRLEESGDPFP